MTDKKRRLFDTSSTIHYGEIVPAVQPWERQPMLPPISEGRREMPMSRANTVESAVKIPAYHGLVVGASWGAVALVVMGIVETVAGWPWYFASVAGLLVMVVVNAFHTTNGVRLVQDLRWRLEKLTWADLDKDGHVGEPTQTLTIELVDHAAKKSLFLDLGIPAEKAAMFARSVLAGRGLSVSEWTGRAGLLSRSEYETMRGKLLEGGLIRWVNEAAKAQGLELTRAGRAVFQKLAESPPTLDGEVVSK